MSQSKVHVFKPQTNLRRGGSTRGPNNVIAVIGIGFYTALEQCAGEDVVDGDDRNYWWVEIDTGTERGWVSAVRIKEGGNNEQVPTDPPIPALPTVFADSGDSVGQAGG